MSTLAAALSIYLLIGLAVGGWFLWLMLSTLSDSWVRDSTDYTESERLSIRAEFRYHLDNVPGKSERGAAIVFAILVVIVWPYALAILIGAMREDR